MEQILESLQIEWLAIEFSDSLEGNGRLGYLVNHSKDRVMILVEIECAEDLLDYAKQLPRSGDTIREFMKRIGDDAIFEGDKITLAQYLWDLYVIGIYNNKEQSLDPMKVSQVERDRFIARKLIIEYKEQQELLDKLNEIIFPHKVLDGQIRRLGQMTALNLTNLTTGLQHIDSANATFEQVTALIDSFEEITGGSKDATFDEIH